MGCTQKAVLVYMSVSGLFHYKLSHSKPCKCGCPLTVFFFAANLEKQWEQGFKSQQECIYDYGLLQSVSTSCSAKML